jgi:F5/8 type C domain
MNMRNRVAMSAVLVSLLSFLASTQEAMSQAPEVALVVATVTASDFQSPNAPKNTLDGNLKTRWSALGDGAWIAYELSQISYVSSVPIAFYRGNERGASFDIYASEEPCTNEEAWRSGFIRNVQSNGLTLRYQWFDFSPRNARCVVLVGHGNDENQWASLTEVRIFGRPTPPPPPPPVDMATCIAPLVPLEDPLYSVNVPSGSVQLTHRFGTRILSAYVAIQRLFAASEEETDQVDICATRSGTTVDIVAQSLEVTEGAVTIEYERPVLSARFQQTCTDTVIRVYRPLPDQAETCTGELLLETVPFIYRAATIAPAF